VLCTVCTYSVRGALHCVHLQCAWCYALCAPTVCVVLCTMCTYSVRGALHCVHLQCAWCYALCAPTVRVVLCTVCTYSARGAMHCVHLQCERYRPSAAQYSQRQALPEKPVVSHLAKVSARIMQS